MNDLPLTLSIIVVNYNGLRFIDECVQSVGKYVTCPHELIIVDNASSDGSADYIATQFPHILLIRNMVNVGFAGGNNIGARAASGELLLLLNNDTKILTTIDDAVSAFRFPSLGVVGVHLVYGDGSNQPSVGHEHTPMRILLSWLGLSGCTKLPSIFRRTEQSSRFYGRYHGQTAWVSGAFLMTRSSLWNSIGGLDEQYFMYMEDVDYCKQVRDRGFTVAYIPTVQVTHYEGGGKAWVGQSALTRTTRSYRIYLAKHYGLFASLATTIVLSLILAIRVPFYLLRFGLAGSIVDREKSSGYAVAARHALFESCRIGLSRLREWFPRLGQR